VYDLSGLYILNLHPERGVLCRKSLEILLASARGRPLPVWLRPSNRWPPGGENFARCGYA
jgi:hypothetical protein